MGEFYEKRIQRRHQFNTHLVKESDYCIACVCVCACIYLIEYRMHIKEWKKNYQRRKHMLTNKYKKKFSEEMCSSYLTEETR